MEDTQEILVFPRISLPTLAPFIPWALTSPFFESIQGQMIWLPRCEAELSKDFFQPIPCAIVRNNTGEYRALRRVKDGREDLRSKVSLVVGGHIDKCNDSSELSSLLLATLKRELNEELGVDRLSNITPVGLVVDHSTANASRHVGFVYEVVVDEDFRPMANEEFSINSKLNDGLFTSTQLSRFRDEFDPWSFIIFSEHIAASYSPEDIGSQPAFTFTWIN